MANKAFLVRDGLRSGTTLVIDSAGNWVGNTITETYGGTNQTTYTTGDILYASGANTLGKLAIAGNGDVLTLAGGVPTWATPVSAPNSFGFVTGDSGSVPADKTSDTVQITGGTGITTSVTGSPAVLVITNDSPNVDQNIWLTIAADSGGPVAANTTSDTLTLAGGTNISSAIAGDTVTFNWSATLNELSDVVAGSPAIGAVLYNDGTNWVKLDRGTNGQVLTMGSPLLPAWQTNAGVQNLWLNIAADTGGPVAANTTTDTLTFTGGVGITTSISGDTVTITNDGSLTPGDGLQTGAGSPLTIEVDSTVARMNQTNTGTFITDIVDLGVIGTLAVSTLTTTALTQVAVASFALATYRSAEFTVQATQGSNYHTTKLLAVHDGVNADSSEYGTITMPSFFGSPATGSPAISGVQATYTVDINGGNLRLLATPVTTSSTVFKVTAHLTKV